MNRRKIRARLSRWTPPLTAIVGVSILLLASAPVDAQSVHGGIDAPYTQGCEGPTPQRLDTTHSLTWSGNVGTTINSGYGDAQNNVGMNLSSGITPDSNYIWQGGNVTGSAQVSTNSHASGWIKFDRNSTDEVSVGPGSAFSPSCEWDPIHSHYAAALWSNWTVQFGFNEYAYCTPTLSGTAHSWVDIRYGVGVEFRLSNNGTLGNAVKMLGYRNSTATCSSVWTYTNYQDPSGWDNVDCTYNVTYVPPCGTYGAIGNWLLGWSTIAPISKTTNVTTGPQYVQAGSNVSFEAYLWVDVYVGGENGQFNGNAAPAIYSNAEFDYIATMNSMWCQYCT